MSVILLGRKKESIQKSLEEIQYDDKGFIVCSQIRELQKAIEQEGVDTVIMGAGLDLSIRLEAVKVIFEASDTVSVHMKDFASGPGGFGSFIKRVLDK